MYRCLYGSVGCAALTMLRVSSPYAPPGTYLSGVTPCDAVSVKRPTTQVVGVLVVCPRGLLGTALRGVNLHRPIKGYTPQGLVPGLNWPVPLGYCTSPATLCPCGGCGVTVQLRLGCICAPMGS